MDFHNRARADHPGDPLRPRLIFITTACALILTMSAVAFPTVRFEYQSREFHIALETAAALTAGLAAFLFFGRLSARREQSNWALVYGLAVSALTNLLLAVVPPMLDLPTMNRFSVWSTVVGRLVAASAFAYGAFAPQRWEASRRSLGVSIVASALATVAGIGLLMTALLPNLPAPMMSVQVAASALPQMQAHPFIVMAQALSMMLFTLAATGYIRRSEHTGDELMRWLAAGSLLAAFSRLHFMLYPSLYHEWVYTGDFLRLGFYAMMLMGAVGELRRYWEGLARGAALEERRRIARDLHDGLAQELAYIATQVRWLRHDGDSDTVRALNAAADRALDESRRAVAALTRDVDEPLEVALAQAAEEVADRVGADVRLELEPGAQVNPDTREALIRIAREAIANAGRHSNAEEVLVRLSVSGQVRLQIVDDGDGFDVSGVRPDRFGLVSMRERAKALDADFLLSSSPGRGTSVEVALP